MHKIDKLILKYLNHSLSQKEWDELNLWFEQNHNEKSFNEYVWINYAIENVMSEFNTEQTKRNLLEKIRKDKRANRVKRINGVLKYAAVLFIILGFGFMLQQGFFHNDKNKVAEPNGNAITLKLDNGDFKVLSENESQDIYNDKGEIIGSQNGNRIAYDNPTDSDNEELIYNQLRIPYGKKFELKLSDGTLVHLNSGSSIKYPIRFLAKGIREVFLEGEAYLEVAKDKSRSFTVNTSNNLKINVLGTKFNVSDYPEDQNANVVLVEGSVGLQSEAKNDRVILEPGFMGSFNKEQKEISTKSVNTDIYTAWINGKLIFRNMSFANILKKLERHYNIAIINRDSELSKKLFNANFGDEPIENVLEEFRVNYGIQYRKENNRIIIQ